MQFGAVHEPEVSKQNHSRNELLYNCCITPNLVPNKFFGASFLFSLHRTLLLESVPLLSTTKTCLLTCSCSTLIQARDQGRSVVSALSLESAAFVSFSLFKQPIPGHEEVRVRPLAVAVAGRFLRQVRVDECRSTLPRRPSRCVCLTHVWRLTQLNLAQRSRQRSPCAANIHLCSVVCPARTAYSPLDSRLSAV
jgi:hypothetical protein